MQNRLIAGQEGCFKGCVRSFLAGGTSGLILGYFIAGFFIENTVKREMFLFIRWGFLTAGWLAGIILWALGEAVYFYFFLKRDKEETL